jgi:type II restriction enzyme
MAEREYLSKESGSKTFRKKKKPVQDLINDALYMLDKFGIPMKDKSPRLKEKTALAFLSLLNMTPRKRWMQVKDISTVQRKTRDIIGYQNNEYGETRSPGSYDDVRREELVDLVLAGIVLNSKTDASRNDPTRGYGISEEYARVVRSFGTKQWDENLASIVKKYGTFSDRIAAKRNVKKVEIHLSDGANLELSSGKHNELHKAVVEEFMSRFCQGASVLYLGDAAKKQLINKSEELRPLGFTELEHGMLPDIIAYDKKKNWLYIIEAVYSSNPIKPNRKLMLEKITRAANVEIVFVSAFLDQKTFRKFASDIAWETEVWIAESPDHMIHFNGDKFLGPYKS